MCSPNVSVHLLQVPQCSRSHFVPHTTQSSMNEKSGIVGSGASFISRSQLAERPFLSAFRLWSRLVRAFRAEMPLWAIGLKDSPLALLGNHPASPAGCGGVADGLGIRAYKLLPAAPIADEQGLNSEAHPALSTQGIEVRCPRWSVVKVAPSGHELERQSRLCTGPVPSVRLGQRACLGK